jgi:uncharacterized membrane protein (UPF0127 family)
MPGRSITIRDETAGCVLAGQAQLAARYRERLIGLLGRNSLRAGEGLALVPCSSVHTLMMRFAIDVAFLGRDFRVLRILPAVRPFRIPPPVSGARLVVELPAGTLARHRVAVGDSFVISFNDGSGTLVSPQPRQSARGDHSA